MERNCYNSDLVSNAGEDGINNRKILFRLRTARREGGKEGECRRGTFLGSLPPADNWELSVAFDSQNGKVGGGKARGYFSINCYRKPVLIVNRSVICIDLRTRWSMFIEGKRCAMEDGNFLHPFQEKKKGCLRLVT
ncbi:hypothetical protein TNCT_40551 [Trichonephila clavata]|uniref:Uncharacterized protein n=1 Tax=Trichonephila clavata TaxID=2740835 RepID=A0A8X6HLG0_TRICU|nr:hypothetical protein TNCT_40551 [Trichonephila clavata]